MKSIDRNKSKNTVYTKKKISNITYNVKSVFDEKSVTENLKKLIEKKIVKSSVKE